jgi:hypothetical protein
MSQYLMPAAAPSPATKRAFLLIPFAVLLVLHPLLIHGPSCGQDLAFHIQSWLDAAHQLRHGTLYPHWDTTSAWNAGEPRFLFYPPLSWLLGAILTLIFPTPLCPTIFIAIALLASGFTFHKLASEFVTPNAALIASTLYLANPYMLFTAFERSALAELLAAAWIPLLLLALLRPRPAGLPAALATIRGIAIPLALLWLTNAPAAVIGSYTLALLATLRILIAIFTPTKLSSRPKAAGRSGETRSSHAPPTLLAPATIRYPKAGSPRLEPWVSSGPPQKRKGFSPWGMPLHLATTYLAGAILGLTLPAIYLLPAAYERKYIQTAMAILPNLRYQDNFLFTPTTDAAHNAVNHTISLLALTLLIVTMLSVIALFVARKNPVILSEGRSPQPKDPEALHPAHTSSPFSTNTLNPALVPTLTLLTLLIAFLLTPISSPIWHHLPNLAYLQFPWRLLTLLTPILALSIALLLDTPTGPSKPAQDPGAPCLDSETWVRRMPYRTVTAITLLLPLALTVLSYRLYHQPPDPTDDPTHLAQLFSTHHGFPPTDEYTPLLADNDPLRTNNPAYWLAHSPNDPAPNTQPTAAALNPTLDTDDTPIPDAQTLSTPAPHHLTLTLTQPSLLVLNLRDYPNWQVTTTTLGTPPKTQLSPSAQDSAQDHIARNDGLIAIALPAGHSTIDITWHRTLDQQLGLALSAISLLTLALTHRRKTTA